MDTTLMNSKNCKTSDPHRLLLNHLADKINLKGSGKYVSLSNFSIYYKWNNIKRSYWNNRFKKSAPTWKEEFELPDGSYFISDIHKYFEYSIKKHETVTGNPSIKSKWNRK